LQAKKLPEVSPPEDWVPLAEVGAPIGLKGAVRLHTLKSVTGLPIDDSLLQDSRDCWVKLKSGQWLHSEILECSTQTRGLKLQLATVMDRNQSELLRGALVGLSRSVFPEPDEDEMYWADLIGCRVVNRQGLDLGLVGSMQTNGEHDWLVVDSGMIPFVAQYIDQVDTDQRLIQVDWDPAWMK